MLLLIILLSSIWICQLFIAQVGFESWTLCGWLSLQLCYLKLLEIHIHALFSTKSNKVFINFTVKSYCQRKKSFASFSLSVKILSHFLYSSFFLFPLVFLAYSLYIFILYPFSLFITFFLLLSLSLSSSLPLPLPPSHQIN